MYRMMKTYVEFHFQNLFQFFCINVISVRIESRQNMRSKATFRNFQTIFGFCFHDLPIRVKIIKRILSLNMKTILYNPSFRSKYCDICFFSKSSSLYSSKFNLSISRNSSFFRPLAVNTLAHSMTQFYLFPSIFRELKI